MSPHMDLLTYIGEKPRLLGLAAAVQRSPGYLWQVATRWRGKRASIELAQAIERESARLGPEAVPKSSLRPDVWPEEQGGDVAGAGADVEVPQQAEAKAGQGRQAVDGSHDGANARTPGMVAA